jgi:hypothetical protein
MTSGRLKRVEQYTGKETFCFTGGYGVSDNNLSELAAYLKSSARQATVTDVQPPVRYGALHFENSKTQFAVVLIVGMIVLGLFSEVLNCAPGRSSWPTRSPSSSNRREKC